MSDEPRPVAIGLDAAIVKCGWAVSTLGGHVLEAGWIDCTGRPRGALVWEVNQLLTTFGTRYHARRSVVALERGYLGKSAATFQELAEVRGEIKANAQALGYRVEYVHHSKWRKSIGAAQWGKKRKELKQDSIAAARLLARTIPIPNDDVADGVCIACYAAAMENQRLRIEEAERRRA